jgi:hypothetical protein
MLYNNQYHGFDDYSSIALLEESTFFPSYFTHAIMSLL